MSPVRTDDPAGCGIGLVLALVSALIVLFGLVAFVHWVVNR
jgi:hypothetical protein